MNEPTLEIVGLSKSYRSLWRSVTTVLCGVTLRVRAGSVFGLVGSNGAGKTTLLHSALGLLQKDGGTVRLWGRDGGCPVVRRRVGFLAEDFAYPGHLTPTHLLELQDRLRGGDAHHRAARVEQALSRVGLAGLAGKPLGSLSKGNRQLAGLSQAILGTPDLLVLDEPASGLDPRGRRLVSDLCLEWKSAGRAVLVSTHVLADAERICDDVGLIHEGRLRFVGPVQALVSRTRTSSLEDAVLRVLANPEIVGLLEPEPPVSRGDIESPVADRPPHAATSFDTRAALAQARVLALATLRAHLAAVVVGAILLVGLAALSTIAGVTSLAGSLHHQFRLVSAGIAIYLGATVVHGEIRRRTIHAVLVRPVARTTFVGGVTIGAGMILAALACLEIVVCAVLQRAPDPPFVPFVQAIVASTVAAMMAMSASMLAALATSSAVGPVLVLVGLIGFDEVLPRASATLDDRAFNLLRCVTPAWDRYDLSANLRFEAVASPLAYGLTVGDALAWTVMTWIAASWLFSRRDLV